MSRERERIEDIGKKIRRDQLNAVEAYPNMEGGRRHILGPPPGGTLNVITPCAACKLLRRRCVQECPFSPYFSPHETQKFASVHKVFGASNVSKMLMEVHENQRADVANSLVYEANVRLRDPIYGCMGSIFSLQQQIQLLQSELNSVRAEILKHKYRETDILPSPQITLLSSGAISVAAPPPPPPPAAALHSLPQNPTSALLYTHVTSSAAADFNTNIQNANINYFD